ncbi:MAG: nucleotidyltransferase family protein [Candidatus Polarisedimenticolaceae bacterium]|nr:nucleotidyltransferase family protein [Candidatus Polarisedimenticolaceae bacterium]
MKQKPSQRDPNESPALQNMEQTCLAILSGKQVRPPEPEIGPLLEFAQKHGITPLLHYQLQPATITTQFPRQSMEKLHAQATLEAAAELARNHELRQVLAALADGGIQPLLMKGTPLAYLIYPNPTLRPRCDTDLLFPIAEKENTCHILTALGYQFPNAVSGNFVRLQATCIKKEKNGFIHQLDLHWKISNLPYFASLLRYENLIKNALSVPELGPNAYTLALADALLFACLHRTGHIADGEGNRLIWLYDIHLLCEALTPNELEYFIGQAHTHRITALCLDALEQTQLRFHTKLSDATLSQLKDYSSQPEPSARYLQGSRIAQLKCNLILLPTIMDKLAYIGEILFPSQSYMLAKYKARNRLLLPLLYLHRFILGCKKQIWRKGK